MTIVALGVLFLAGATLAFQQLLAGLVELPGTLVLLTVNLGLIGCAQWINSHARDGVFKHVTRWAAMALFGMVIVLHGVELLDSVAGNAAPSPDRRPAKSRAQDPASCGDRCR
jgi:hypothetical protein